MKVSELGEFGLIDTLAAIASRHVDPTQASWQKLVLGIGDDAAAWRTENGLVLATTDAFVEGVHFKAGLGTWEDIGWKAMAANLSDIAAMGGAPRYALVALALPGGTSVEDMTALYTGMTEIARQYEIAIVGGNTSKAREVSVTITVLGIAEDETRLLRRSTATPGQLVAVTGYTGLSAAGLKILSRQKSYDKKTEELFRAAHLRPRPRIAEGRLLAQRGVRTAIDISDGLIADLAQICKASGVGATLEATEVPLHSALKAAFGRKALEMALSGGEDYELLFTGEREVVESVADGLSCPVSVIGRITGEPGGVTIVGERGQPITPTKRGWEHFRS